jgi:hypothetical protein
MESLHTSTHISIMIKKFKTKKAIKYILKHPELFTEGEVQYVKLMQQERKVLKKKHESSETDLSNS